MATLPGAGADPAHAARRAELNRGHTKRELVATRRWRQRRIHIPRPNDGARTGQTRTGQHVRGIASDRFGLHAVRTVMRRSRGVGRLARW